MILVLKTEDKYDQLVASIKDQYGYATIINKSINVNDQSILPNLMWKNEAKSVFAQTSNSDDAFNVFKFAADNSNVEWSLSAYNSDGETNFLINSEFSSNQSDTGLGSYFKAQDLKFNIHSHSDKDGTTGGKQIYSRFKFICSKYGCRCCEISI